MLRLLIIFFVYTYARQHSHQLQCPTQEDRAIATYSGYGCYRDYGCCFQESIDNIGVSCCYAYGSNGPYKCCSNGAILTDIIVILSFIVGTATICTAYMMFSFLYSRYKHHRQDSDIVSTHDDNVTMDKME